MIKNETVFWLKKPQIIFQKNVITEISFNNKMSLEEKLNALTRFVILVTTLGYILMRQTSILLLGITFLAIIVLYYYYLKDNKKFKESFTMIHDIYKPNELDTYNPFDNPLTNDFDTLNKPTEALNNEVYKDEITEVAKSAVLKLNENNKDKNRLFNDLETNLSFENSMRQFHSISGSSVPNNQDNFLKYCYGSLPSDKNISVF
tara:strand:- start:1900 stop:2511 length:612 start_codon:yes stop_codon:yes gene_type:complete